MGKRKRVKENTNKNGNGESSNSTSSSSMEMSKGQSLTTDNKMEGGGNSSKKMKRVESSNACVGIETEAGQESEVKQVSMDILPPENTDSNAEPSSSSSFKTSRKEASYSKTGELELTRKREMDDVFTDWSINDLPPEMLTKILESVDTRSLFKCRLVSRQWLEISSEILASRPGSLLGFKKVYDIHAWTIYHDPIQIAEYHRLQEFVDCMKKCSNCPCTRFSFDIAGPSFFDGKDWIQFLSIFAPSNPNPNQRTKIKYLRFHWYSIESTKELLRFTEKLRDLLVNKIPRLEELYLDLYRRHDHNFEDSKDIKLFPLPKSTEPKSQTTTTVQLPYLKELELQDDMFYSFAGIVEDLLNAAVNLTEIHVDTPCWVGGDSPSLVFQFLHCLGKLHLFKTVEINLDENFLSDVKRSIKDQKSNFLLGFKVEELKLDAFTRDISPPFYADATTFISNLLESSKDTLEKLKFSPLGFLDELHFPKFTNLKILKVSQCKYRWNELQEPFFPPGIKSTSRDIFATVEYLNVRTPDWSNAFPQEDSIPIFSSVHSFWLSDKELAENVIAKLGLMCPNLKHCRIQTWRGNPENFNFLRVGREIWTHLKQLECLAVDVDLNLEHHAFPALDSCFTGISMENCQRLYELIEAEKTKNRNSTQVKLPESEEIMKLTQREHPSILDLKNLKALIVNPHFGKRRHQGGNFFIPTITWISEEFAFKLMPQLQFNGRRPSTSS